MVIHLIKKTNSIAAIVLILITNSLMAQTTYTSASNGNWSITGSWDANGKPPSPLPSGDSIIVKHAVVFNTDQDILGVMIVNYGASVIGVNKKLKIGKGSIDQGELFNNGTISVKDLEVKPDNGCTVTRILPIAHNYGNITTRAKLHIGNNCGAGAFYNYSGGQIFVGGEFHLDNYLWNEDSIFVTGNFKNHGGYAEGGGFIETPFLDIDENNGRPGTFDFIEICGPTGLAPTINAGGSVYTDLNDLYTNAPAVVSKIDPDSTTFCGLAVLPVTLQLFNIELLEGNAIALKWRTTAEYNNHGWEIQRSNDGINWATVAFVYGAGFSQSVKSYKWLDLDPLVGTESFYRIKQLDFNGNFSISEVRDIDLRSLSNKLKIWPNPALETTTIAVSNIGLGRLGTISIFDQVGREIVSTEFVNVGVGQKIDLKGLKSGIYVIHVSIGNEVSYGRILKK